MTHPGFPWTVNSHWLPFTPPRKWDYFLRNQQLRCCQKGLCLFGCEAPHSLFKISFPHKSLTQWSARLCPLTYLWLCLFLMMTWLFLSPFGSLSFTLLNTESYAKSAKSKKLLGEKDFPFWQRKGSGETELAWDLSDGNCPHFTLTWVLYPKNNEFFIKICMQTYLGGGGLLFTLQCIQNCD